MGADTETERERERKRKERERERRSRKGKVDPARPSRSEPGREGKGTAQHRANTRHTHHPLGDEKKSHTMHRDGMEWGGAGAQLM